MHLGAEQRYYLKLKILYYYYEKNYTQSEIAKMVNISRMTLSKLLKEAKQEGLIKVEIIDTKNLTTLLELESRIKEKYRLDDIKIVDCFEYTKSEIYQKISAAGARYIELLLKSNMKIGIAWGQTLEMVVDNLYSNKSIRDIEILTLLGGASTANSSVQPNVLAQKFLQKYHGKGYIINAPYLCKSKVLRDAIMQEPNIKDTIQKIKQSDITLVGIGHKLTVDEQGYYGYDYEPEEIRELEGKGAVGDICANFFDKDGKIIHDIEIADRIVSIDIEQLKEHKKVIAVAGGENKVEAILGALKGGYIDVLIIDKFTAEIIAQKM